MKKLLAIMLTAVMLLALAIPAFADATNYDTGNTSVCDEVVIYGKKSAGNINLHLNDEISYCISVEWESSVDDETVTISLSGHRKWNPVSLTWDEFEDEDKKDTYDDGDGITITYTVINTSNADVYAAVSVEGAASTYATYTVDDDVPSANRIPLLKSTYFTSETDMVADVLDGVVDASCFGEVEIEVAVDFSGIDKAKFEAMEDDDELLTVKLAFYTSDAVS